MGNSLLVPGSIVFGAGIIALGLYFGLRAQPEATRTPPSGVPASVAATVASPESHAPARVAEPPLTTPDPLQPSVTPEVLEKARASAAKSLADAKARTLLPSCWKPALEKNPHPPTARFTLSLGFDAQGTQIGWGVGEDREAIREDVAACLRKQPMFLTIEAPGQSVSFELPLEFP